jgi:outer membrane phospholipase A
MVQTTVHLNKQQKAQANKAKAAKDKQDALVKAREDIAAAQIAAAQKKSDAHIKKQEIIAQARATLIASTLPTWKADVQAVYQQVTAARRTNPNANAGSNPGIADIPGGLDNELTLKLGGTGSVVTWGEVFQMLPGADGSDKGRMKVRRAHTGHANVLIHCCEG